MGSAGYYRDDLSSPQFQPQFDVLGDGWRQPGSAFKPFNYVTGINDGTMTAATMFMDVTTTFGNSGRLHAQGLRPARARPGAPAPGAAVLAQHPRGQGAVDQRHQQRLRQGAAVRLASSRTSSPRAGLSLTLGTEVSHPLDVADGLRDDGQPGLATSATRAILTVQDANGKDLVPPVPMPGRHAGRHSAGGLHHDRHPGRQH